jgi:DNA-binding NarL/FixJ family response regulator
MRAMIAEDSGLLRELMVRVFEENGIEVTGVAGSEREILDLVRADPPDVVVLDIRMPPTHTDEGVRVAGHVRAHHAEVGVLLLSHYAETAWLMDLFEHGASGLGYLVKDRVGDSAFLVEAVRRVANGETVIDPDVVTNILERKRTPDPLLQLTESERQVLVLMAEGWANVEIARRIGYSVKTVEKRVTTIAQKFGMAMTGEGRETINVRVAAVITYLRNSPPMVLSSSRDIPPLLEG